MNQYYRNWLNDTHPRDYVFVEALNLLNHQPAKILEIGTSRRLESNAHSGDGYSTYNWCEYILDFGGKLVICDVDPQCLENCKILISDFIGKIDIEFHLRDGLELIDDTYDLIYLDGSDSPTEMVDQYNKIDRSKTLILCDDWNGPGGKGDILKTIQGDFIEYPCGPTHKMAIYPKLSACQYCGDPYCAGAGNDIEWCEQRASDHRDFFNS